MLENRATGDPPTRPLDAGADIVVMPPHNQHELALWAMIALLVFTALLALPASWRRIYGSRADAAWQNRRAPTSRQEPDGIGAKLSEGATARCARRASANPPLAYSDHFASTTSRWRRVACGIPTARSRAPRATATTRAPSASWSVRTGLARAPLLLLRAARRPRAPRPPRLRLRRIPGAAREKDPVAGRTGQSRRARSLVVITRETM